LEDILLACFYGVGKCQVLLRGGEGCQKMAILSLQVLLNLHVHRWLQTERNYQGRGGYLMELKHRSINTSDDYWDGYWDYYRGWNRKKNYANNIGVIESLLGDGELCG